MVENYPLKVRNPTMLRSIQNGKSNEMLRLEERIYRSRIINAVYFVLFSLVRKGDPGARISMGLCSVFFICIFNAVELR